ncbi:GNAT family N-acetyltransferase [Clostridium sp. D2Q-11]|uniref:GNAT family N-acetyltransferase n=1 Tax=Anaeromonas frigoriresistens TaxID=2683708 RepID=A0A942URF0_9FIRM|nr:GNAT family N-acetyltransferase [Anaeromonas frigoriresistens]MBS4537813.1 GNAT family N-acetyltransferase [Anaeromonas frigoriresistens]
MLIRKANSKDINSILDLWKKLSDYHEQFDDYMSLSSNWRKNLFEIFYEDLESRFSKIFIGEIDNRCIGFIRMEIREMDSVFKSNKTVFITDIFVEESYRGTLLSEKLIEKAEDYSKKEGVFTIKLNVNTQNRRAIGLYEKKGFIEVNKTFKKDINV